MTISRTVANQNEATGKLQFTNPFAQMLFIDVDEKLPSLQGSEARDAMKKLKSLFFFNGFEAVCLTCKGATSKTKRKFVHFEKVKQNFFKANDIEQNPEEQIRATAFLKSFVHIENGQLAMLSARAMQS